MPTLLFASVAKHTLTFHEDNQAMVSVIETGRNPTMRHLQRAHRVSVAWFYEIFQSEFLSLRYAESSRIFADILLRLLTMSESGGRSVL